MKALYTQELMNIHPALEGSKSVSAGLALGQRLQQGLGVLEVRCVEPFGEPTVDRRQQLVGFGALTLVLPQPTEAHAGPQLPRSVLLAAGYGEGLLEAGFRLRCVRDGLLEQEVVYDLFREFSAF